MSVSAVPAPSVIPVAIEHYPGLSRFALDLVSGRFGAARFCRRAGDAALSPRSHHGLQTLVDALAETNRGWGNDVAADLRRWTDGETVTIVAGQQVGFGGGPVYTFAKIASLLKLRQMLANQNVASTLFFWLATEDHDFEEIATLLLRGNPAPRVLSTAWRPQGRRVVGSLALPEDLRQAAVAQFGDADWLREGITFRDSFARLLANVFAGDGVVFVDALLPELRSSGIDLLVKLVESEETIQSSLGERARELADAGYRAQVDPAADGAYSLLFWVGDDGERVPLRRDGDRWRIGARSIDTAELIAAIRREPWRASTAAITRPLLQDAVFGTDIFVGGPAEVTYYAQISAIAPLLGVHSPAVALRGHALFVPARLLPVIERESIAPEELFDEPDAIAARRASPAVDAAIETASAAEADLVRRLREFRATVQSVDGTVDRAIETSLRKIHYQFGRIRRRGVRAIARRERERYEAIRRLSDAIAPGGTPQDRTIAWLPFWTEHGRQLVERTVAEIHPASPTVAIIGV